MLASSFARPPRLSCHQCHAASKPSQDRSGSISKTKRSNKHNARKPDRPASKPAPGSPQSRQQPTAGPKPAGRRQRPQPLPISQLGCIHFSECAGCSIENSIERPPLAERAASFFREWGLEQLDVTCAGIHNWRCRARLAVRGTPGKAILGLFREASHEVVDIPDCRVHHPRVAQAAQLLQQLVNACRIEPYHEGTRSGQLRYVQLTAVPSAGHKRAEDDPDALVQVVLVWNCSSAADPSCEQCRRLAQQAWLYAGSAPSSRPGAALLSAVWANFNAAAGNTILGGSYQVLHGAAEDWQQFGACDTLLGPGSFVQANYSAMQACLQAMAAWVPQGTAVAELYAGAGAIGLHVAASRQLRWLRCVEINPQCLHPFERSRARLVAGLQISFHVAAAEEDPGGWLSGADVIIMDPPRKGLESSVLQALLDAEACRAQRLLYLSCGYHALEREAGVLLGSGQWRLAHAQAFLFFPGTDSLETLAVFDRL